MGFLTVVGQVSKTIGLGALRLMTMGAVFTATQELTERNRKMSRDFNQRVGSAYEFGVKPRIARGFQVFKGGKS